MKIFFITTRTITHYTRYTASAVSSSQAAIDAAEMFGDTPCGITVICTE